ncbi:MAG: thiamine pyrophosphate-dependent dehydrogenase E1 component subunit alpha [Chloroflexi bacterium]|nr:thiamine pyrophosphate-dependent dehydrogenase E1 component subunit alpha [Chloroflexota bacterium]
MQKESAVARPSAHLDADTLRQMYWIMLLSRRTDERAWVLHRQGKIAFHISAMGHEACQVGMAFAIQRGVDYVNPYYRDLALVMALGVTPAQFMVSLFGKVGEYSSGGRQMPSHFGYRPANIISGSAPVATQVPQAAGLAFAIKYRQQMGLVDANDATQPRLALTCLGEGSTSQGEWHEGMNWAGVHKLPFICMVQNNEYAISVPIEAQMAVSNVADRAAAYGVTGVVVDGNDVLAVYDVAKAAVERAYTGGGATLIEAKTYRLTPHSSDDDDRTYRSREEVETWKKKDPILRFQNYLLENSIMTQAELDDADARAKSIVDAAQAEAESTPYPAPEFALGAVYAEEN